jgi:hypothetical protein
MMPRHQPISARRWSSTPRRISSTAIGRFLVELEEDLLEVGGLRDEIDDRVSGGLLHNGVHCRLRRRQTDDRAVDAVHPALPRRLEIDADDPHFYGEGVLVQQRGLLRRPWRGPLDRARKECLGELPWS